MFLAYPWRHSSRAIVGDRASLSVNIRRTDTLAFPFNTQERVETMELADDDETPPGVRSLRGAPGAPAAAPRPAASVPRTRTQDPAMASTHHAALGVPGEEARRRR